MNGYRYRSMSYDDIQALHYREKGKLSYSSCFWLSAIALLYSLFFPLLLHGTSIQLEMWSWAMTVVCIAFVWFSIRKARWTVLTVLISLLFISLTQSPLIPAIVIGTVVAVCAYSSLVYACGRSNLAFPITVPLIVYACSLILTLDPISSLFSLIFLLPAAALGLSCRLGASLNASIVWCSTAIIFPLVALLAASVYSAYGRISFAALTLYASSARERLESYAQYYASAVNGIEPTQALYREISEAVNACVNLAPGLIVALCLVFSFLVNSLKNDLLQTQEALSEEHSEKNVVSVSAVTALLFIIAHVMSFTTDAANDTAFIAVVFGNISLMLLPALALVGMAAISGLNKRLGILSVFVFALLIFVLFSATSSFFILIALVGAFAIILRSIDSWAKDFYGKGDNQ